jgi:hypothetical protein
MSHRETFLASRWRKTDIARRLIAVGSVALSGGSFLLLTLGLYWLYKLPQFGERPEHRLLIVEVVVFAGISLLLISPIAQRLVALVTAPLRRFDLKAVFAFALLAFVGFCLVAQYVLQSFPNSGDELAVVLQAETYAQGRLWADPPPVVEAFRQYRFFDVGDKWVSQYPPGWAIALAPAVALGLPLWMVTALCGAATLFAFFWLARLEVSPQSAWIGVITLGTSAFFILNSASFFSHSLATFCGVLFALLGLRYVEKEKASYALAAGACLGVMGLTRPQNALVFLVPYAVTLLIAPDRRRGLIWLGAGGLPFLFALLAYNDALTGNPLTGVTAHFQGEPFQLPTSEAIWRTEKRLRELIVWTSPILVAGYAFGLGTLIIRRETKFTDWIMPLTIFFFLFFPGEGGNQYGWPF